MSENKDLTGKAPKKEEQKKDDSNDENEIKETKITKGGSEFEDEFDEEKKYIVETFTKIKKDKEIFQKCKNI